MADNTAIFNNGADFGADVSITGSLTSTDIYTTNGIRVDGYLTGSARFDLPAKTTPYSIGGLLTLTNTSSPSLFDVNNGNIMVYPFANSQIRFGFAAQGFFNNFRCDIFNSGATLSSGTSNTRTVQLQATPPNDGGANFACTCYGYNGTTLVYYYSSQAVGTTWQPTFYLKPGGRATVIMDYTNRQIVFQADGVQTSA